MADLHLPDLFVGIAFNAEPFDPAAVPTWSNLSARAVNISSANRGRQYELDQNQTGGMDVTWVNIDEALNPANTGSPYSPNVQPYRQILARCMWPNGGTGNLFNLAYNGTDPGFESYTAGAAVLWITPIGAGVTPTVVAATAFQGTKSLTYVVTNGGGAQGILWAVPCIPGRQYTTSAYVIQQFANTTGISVSGGGAGSSTAVTAAYVRVSVTFTATQPTHNIIVQSSPTGITGIVNIDALQHEPGAAATTFTTTGPLIRNIWTRGYVERWPAQWDETGFEGRSTTPCVGPFAILQNAGLRTAYRDAVMVKAPQYFWMLAEPSGSTSFIDSSGNSGPPVIVQASPGGAGTAPAAGTNHLMAGDPQGTGVQFVEGVPTSGSPIGSILGTGQTFPGTPYVAFPSTATGSSWVATFTGWIKVTYPLLGAARLFKTTKPGNAGNTPYTCLVQANTDGTLFILLGNVGTSVNAAANTAPGALSDGKPHHVVALLSQVNGGMSTITIYLDGVLAGTGGTLTSSTGLITVPSNSVMVGGTSDGLGNFAAIMPGYMAMIALFSRTLSVAEITDLYQASRGYAGELESTRIARYLTLAGYVGPTAIGTGASVMGASTVRQGDAALASCQQAADSAFGNFYESADGIAYASRNARYLQTTSLYTFGENVAGGEYPYLGDIRFDYDPTLVLNIADVTRTGGIVGHAEDATGFSQKRYGRKNFTRQIDIASDNETIDAATWVVANRKATQMRVASVTFDAAATRVPFGDGTLWPMLLTLEIGTRVTVKRRPKSANAGVGITMSGDFFVEKIEHHDIDFEAGTWLVTLQLSPVSIAQPWILQDAVYGQLDVTTVLGF